MEYVKRTHPRLRGYDYSASGAYFVTICTHNRIPYLSRVYVGRADPGAPDLRLSPTGEYLKQLIEATPQHYPGVSIDNFIIMPNHFHVLLTFGDGAPGSARPTLSQIIKLWKRFTNKKAGVQLWQSSFHDHIIRDERDYLQHWQYIDDNPAKWLDDPYFCDTINTHKGATTP